MWQTFCKAMILVLVLNPLSIAAQHDLEAMEVGVDRPGGDYEDFDVSGGAEACRRRCLDDDRCQAWTFVGPDAPDGAGHCWLKDQIPDARPMADAVSGVIGLRLAEDHWSEPRRVSVDEPWADLVVRTGDVDNFGFGWRQGFNPFSGETTESHPYPYQPEEDDPAGTDRIMVGSGYDGSPPRGKDGYTDSTTRPDNSPRAIVVELPAERPETESVLLQWFVDDFQAPMWGAHYQVKIDGERMQAMELGLNTLEQTGPVGKLISLALLPEYQRLLEDGELEIMIDDPETGAGDGYAVDFVRVLFNPENLPYTGEVHGEVVRERDFKPVPGALVTSALGTTETDSAGRYSLNGVPAGLAIVSAAKDGYRARAGTVEIIDGRRAELNFKLAAVEGDRDTLARSLDTKGRARIPGIYFDLDSAKLKNDSFQALERVLTVLKANPERHYVIEGHTDSQAGDAYNLELSQRRADAVAAWLTDHGIDAGRLEAVGYGEARPVADNGTASGRALNRRVEIAVANNPGQGSSGNKGE